MLRQFSNFKVGHKILAINGLLAFIFILVMTYAVWALNSSQSKIRLIMDDSLAALTQLGEMRQSFSMWRIQLYKHSAAKDTATMQHIAQEIETTLNRLKKETTDYEATIDSEKEAQTFKQYKVRFTQYEPMAQQFLDLSFQNKNDEADALLQKNDQLFSAAISALNADAQYNADLANQRKLAGENDYQKSLFIFGVVILGYLTIAITLSQYLSSLIVRPVRDITEAANRIANGDISKEVRVLDTQDELGQLTRALSTMNNNLRRLVSSLKVNASNLTSSAEELNVTSSQMKGNTVNLNQVTTQTSSLTANLDHDIKAVASAITQSSNNISTVFQSSGQVENNIENVNQSSSEVEHNLNDIAAAVEEMSAAVATIAAAIEEMTASLSEVSLNAGKAAEIASLADKRATGTQKLMGALEISAKEIGDVLELIQGISAQTNLLALNATIEAASAGEAGKGFAVVANEVKELAKQSSEATEGIRQKIEEIQKNTSETTSAIGEISDIISEINNINTSIAHSIEEQSATVNEISHSISGAASASSEVSQSVQQAAGLANNVTRQAEEARLAIVTITRNLEEVAQGSREISSSADSAASQAIQMSESISTVSLCSKDTEQNTQSLESTATELSKLANTLEKDIQQFVL